MVFCLQTHFGGRRHERLVPACCFALGCGPRALRWVDVLLAPRAARVMYNGWLSRPFLMGNGVPQGDPLSPLLARRDRFAPFAHAGWHRAAAFTQLRPAAIVQRRPGARAVNRAGPVHLGPSAHAAWPQRAGRERAQVRPIKFPKQLTACTQLCSTRSSCRASCIFFPSCEQVRPSVTSCRLFELILV